MFSREAIHSKKTSLLLLLICAYKPHRYGESLDISQESVPWRTEYSKNKPDIEKVTYW